MVRSDFLISYSWFVIPNFVADLNGYPGAIRPDEKTFPAFSVRNTYRNRDSSGKPVEGRRFRIAIGMQRLPERTALIITRKIYLRSGRAGIAGPSADGIAIIVVTAVLPGLWNDLLRHSARMHSEAS